MFAEFLISVLFVILLVVAIFIVGGWIGEIIWWFWDG